MYLLAAACAIFGSLEAPSQEEYVEILAVYLTQNDPASSGTFTQIDLESAKLHFKNQLFAYNWKSEQKDLLQKSEHFLDSVSLCQINFVTGHSIHSVIQELEFQHSRHPKFETGKPAPKQRLCEHRCDAGGFEVWDASEAENQLLSHNVYLHSDPDLFFELPLSHEEEKTIYKIITTLADNNIFGLLFEKSDLERKGRHIEQVHPMRFLGAIFSNHQLRISMHEIKKSNFKWDGFMEGLERRMREESHKDNLMRYVPGFAKLLHADPEKIGSFIHHRNWLGLVKYLM